MKKVMALVLLVCVVFTACGQAAGEGTPSETAASAPLPGGNAAANVAVNVEPAESGTEWETFSFAAQSPAPDGCYILVTNDESTGSNIMYIDYAANRLAYLCNRPECVHGDDTCLSYRINAMGLHYYGGKLYIISTENGISVCDATGENAKTVGTLGGGSYLLETCAIRGSSLYFIGVEFDDSSGAAAAMIQQMDLSGGGIKTICEGNYADCLFAGGHGDEMILLKNRQSSPESEYMAVNVSGGAARLLRVFENGTYLGSSKTASYTARFGDNELDVMDFSTGNTSTITIDTGKIKMAEIDVKGLAPEDAAYMLGKQQSVRPEGIYGAYLFVSSLEANNSDGSSQTGLYAIHSTGGEITRIALVGSYRNYPVNIIGETPSAFLVLRDYTSTPMPAVGPDGEAYQQERIMPLFAMIAKDDLMASNPAYIDIAYAAQFKP